MQVLAKRSRSWREEKKIPTHMTCCQSTEAVSYWFEGIIKKRLVRQVKYHRWQHLKKKRAKKNDEKKKGT